MAAASFLKALYLSYLSKPQADRALFRAIQKQRPRRILELGLGTAGRAVRMIEMAQRATPDAQISYTATDLFESRTPVDGPGLTLKRAHQLLGATGARVRLLPGDPGSALARSANGLMGTDLVIISASHDADSLKRAWFYLPRVLRPESLVFRAVDCPPSGAVMRQLAAAEISRLARDETLRRAA